MRWQTRKDCRFDLEAPPSDQHKISLTLPILTVSEANTVYSDTRLVKTGKRKGLPAREHWREAWLRHKGQKEAIHLGCRAALLYARLPCMVRLVRLGPRELDFDNLVVSQKYIRDAVAELLTGDMCPGRADSDKRITWEYAQEKSKQYYVKIEITW